MMKNNPEELELAKKVARKAKKLAQERQEKMLATVRAEFYVQLSEVLKAGVVKAATWHVGENTPPADFGRAGDLYLDITTADVLFNNAGDWQVVLNVRPKDGIDGKDGEKGEKGDRGATGLAGERGKAGRDGKDGKDGKDGRDGVDGARGKDGKDGRDGSRWYAEKGKPTYTIGKKGDFFINSTTGDFYQKTSDLSWVKKGSLKPDAVAGGFIVSNSSSGGGEGGAVNSVNSKTGDVVINPDDLDDSSTTNKFITASELADIASNTTARHTHSNKSVLDATTASFTTADETKLDGIEAGADVTDAATVDAAGAVMNGDFSTNGILTRTGAGAYTSRTITGTTNQVTVTNADGVSGNPRLSLPQNIHTTAQPTFGGLTINGTHIVNGDVAEGVYLNIFTPNTNTAPQRISRIRQNNRGIIDAIGAFSGFGDYLYCADRNPAYTITTTGVTNPHAMFDSNLSGGADIPVANLGTTPAVIEIVRTDGGIICMTDVATLMIVGHRLYADETLTSYKVETKGSDGVWRTELDRTGVTDLVDGAISIPLHVYGNTYAAGDPPPPSNGYHAVYGIRLTIRGATAPTWNSGKFRIAELQLRDSRPSFTPAKGLGALDVRGGEMYGDISLPSVNGTKIGTAAAQKLGFYGATPTTQPTATPANATDLATALTLINDLKAKLIALGLIS
jgi:hypothetical protein